MRSLRERFIRIVLFAGVVAVAVTLGVTSVLYFTQVRWSRNQIAKTLSKTVEQQTQSLSASLLIPEQSAGRAPLLEAYKTSEGLSFSGVVSSSEELPSNFSDCKRANVITQCLAHDGAIAILAPISPELNLGHYIKARVAQTEDGLWLFYYAVGAIAAVMLVVTMTVILLLRLYQQFAKSLVSLESWTSEVALTDGIQPRTPDLEFGEIDLLGRNIQRLIEEGSELKRNAVATEIAKQLVHDIRSPLQALSVLVGTLPEESLGASNKKTIEKITERISGIAESLLSRKWSRETDDLKKIERKTPKTELISCVQDIFKEKQLQYSKRGEISLQLHAPKNRESFAALSSIEFKRALSNLIDNALESIDVEGSISLEVEIEDSEALIFITDSGRGIPESILKNLGKRGVSTKSRKIAGLGIFHAMQTIQSAQGKIEFESKVGQGTTVILRLPLLPVAKPLETLSAIGCKQVVIVDDDPTMHLFWDRAFAEFDKHLESETQVLHFETASGFQNWIAEVGTKRDRLYFVDFDLSQGEPDGLSLIETNDLQEVSALVTSRADDEQLQTRARESGVRVFSKKDADQILKQIMNQEPKSGEEKICLNHCE